MLSGGGGCGCPCPSDRALAARPSTLTETTMLPCPRTGLLASRAKPLEHAWARVAREAVGPWHVGLPRWAKPYSCCDVTRVSAPAHEGWPMLAVAERRKYHCLPSSTCRTTSSGWRDAPRLPDLQVSWLLRLYCTFPRTQYILRTLPPTSTSVFAAEHDFFAFALLDVGVCCQGPSRLVPNSLPGMVVSGCAARTPMRPHGPAPAPAPSQGNDDTQRCPFRYDVGGGEVGPQSANTKPSWCWRQAEPRPSARSATD